jgi:hypothetical protein
MRDLCHCQRKRNIRDLCHKYCRTVFNAYQYRSMEGFEKLLLCNAEPVFVNI